MKSPNLPDDENPCRPRHFRPEPCAPGHDEEKVSRILETSRARLVATGLAFLVAFLVICARLADVTLLQEADDRFDHPPLVKDASFGRADIVDRNGEVLATTLDTPSLFANPKLITDPKGVAASLAQILPGADEAELAAKLSSGKGFVWLHRHLDPTLVEAVNRLGIPGLDFQHEERRVYPQGRLTSHIIGYNDVDGHGLAGIERSFDAALAQGEKPLQLSIDLRIQAIVREETERAIEDFNAIGGTGIVMDVHTGEILSLVSLPDFDPNLFGTEVPKAIFNRATLGVYEMGSVFKIFNTALALEDHKVTLDSMFDVSHPIHVGRFTIHDYHPENHPISVADIFMVSSNIGSAKMAIESGPQAQKTFLGSLGLLQPAAIEIPEIGVPKYPSDWREVNTMTIAFGHGMSVSPMQMAVAANAIVNHGIMVPATLIRRPEGYIPAGTRVVSEATSAEMRKLLRLVVTDGTGKNADVPGYLVGGKTGTAEKVSGHGYAKKALLSSFIGFFPIDAPRYMVYIIIDEPHGNKKSFGFATAGWTAAPAVQRVIARMAPLLGVKPVEEAPENRPLLTTASISGTQAPYCARAAAGRPACAGAAGGDVETE